MDKSFFNSRTLSLKEGGEKIKVVFDDWSAEGLLVVETAPMKTFDQTQSTPQYHNIVVKYNLSKKFL